MKKNKKAIFESIAYLSTEFIKKYLINYLIYLLIGVDPAKTAMAIAYGDSWTNMIQPFWALPALGIAKLGARDIMDYTLIILITTGIIISLGLLFLQLYNLVLCNGINIFLYH